MLGCADAKEIRDSVSGKEWYLLNDQMHEKDSDEQWSLLDGNFSDLRPGPQQQPYPAQALQTLRLLGLSLKFSDTKAAFTYQDPSVLDAQRRVLLIMSLPLDPEQWKIEARRIFEISLARMQGDILDIARGKGANEVSVSNLLGNSNAEICSMIKFQAVGWSNVSLVGFVSLLGLAFVLYLSTIEVGKSILLVWLCLHVLCPKIRGMASVVGSIFQFIWPYLQAMYKAAVKCMGNAFKALCCCRLRTEA